MIDTHAHLDGTQFKTEGITPQTLLQEARAAGLSAIITVGTHESSDAEMLAVAETEPDLYCAVGLHPHEAKNNSPAFEAQLAAFARHPKAVAIGETGLDFHYDFSPREVQQAAFEMQIALAQSLNKPLVLHVREAHPEALAILKAASKKAPLKGVCHCFSGNLDEAKEYIALGFFISFNGVLTFKKSTALREVCRGLRIEDILLETDCPYLAPEPHRGRTNRPALLPLVCKTVAEVQGLTPADVERVTDRNARTLFGLGSLRDTRTIVYPIREALYINLTNRCNAHCVFCTRVENPTVKGHSLKLTTQEEPTAEEVLAAIGDPSHYKEFVFCGFGEPTLKLDVLKQVAKSLKGHGARVRVNTNGLASLTHQRNILPEMKGLIDTWSISLDAQDAATYGKLVRPHFPPETAYAAVKDFIQESARLGFETVVTTVDLPEVDIAACEAITKTLGGKYRQRHLDVTG